MGKEVVAAGGKTKTVDGNETKTIDGNETNAYNGKTTMYVVLTSIMAACGGLTFGYSLGVSGGVTAMKSFLEKFFPYIIAKAGTGNNYCKYNDQFLQTFTSSLFIAGLLATYVAGYTSRKFGRLLTMRVAAISAIAGAALCASAPSFVLLIVGRMMLGVGVGFANQAVPVYLSEMAPTNLRGSLNVLFQLALTVGIFAANLVNYRANRINGWGWRLALGGAGVPAAILGFGALILLETPTSLIERGKFEEGKRVLQKVRGVEDVENEYEDIVAASVMAKSVENPYRNILQRRARPQLVIAILMQFFQQFTGVNAVFFYAPILFQTLGFGSASSLYAAVITGVVNMLSTVVAVIIVDKVGRRKLLIEAGVQMVIATLWLGIILGIQLPANGKLPHSSATVSVVLICVFVAAFAWSWGPLAWLIPSEIFPLDIRSAGQSINVSANLFFTFLIAQFFVSMLCSLQYGIFIFFAGWDVIMTLFVIFLIPETKGVPMEDMQQVFGRHWYWKRFTPAQEIQGHEINGKNDLPHRKAKDKANVV